MPLVSTKVDRCQGHDSCDPRPFDSFSPDVLVEGQEVARETDVFQTHGCSEHPSHDAVVTRGYASVRANGLPVAYIGASVSCDSSIVATGRPSVMVGEGGRIRFGD
ncbi:MAG: PaaR repeat-containing protein [Deltaproteobacteria bacterium]|nr:PaaR repeat-containing protein [Deltaproteobacteria bacterium]